MLGWRYMHFSIVGTLTLRSLDTRINILTDSQRVKCYTDILYKKICIHTSTVHDAKLHELELRVGVPTIEKCTANHKLHQHHVLITCIAIHHIAINNDSPSLHGPVSEP